MTTTIPTTTTHEIADGIYRISTFLPDVSPRGFTMNQFLIDADEPLLFHTGLRGLFPLVRQAVAAIRPVEDLRWISFGHVEADECGSMNEWLAVAPNATVAHTMTACMVSVNDLADRAPRPLTDEDRIELGGGKVVRSIATPHVPHNWESHVLFEESTGTLLCGDIFTAVGNGPALVEDDLVGAALEAESMFQATSLAPAVGATLRRLSDLQPTTLAVMHGSSFRGDGGKALLALADAYDAYAPPTA